MVRRFFRDSATYAVAGVLSQGIAFVLFPFLAHVFRPHDYGVIDLLGVLATLANLTVALEINQGLGRYFQDTDDEAERVLLASTALWFTVAAYSAFAAVTLVLAGPITRAVLDASVDPWVTRVAIVGLWCSGVLYVAQDQLRWRMRPRAFASVSVVLAGVATATTAVLVLGFDVGVIGALIGQLAGAAAALVVVLVLSRGAYARVFDRTRWRAMVAFSLPLVPSSLGVFMNNFSDRVALRQARSLADVGVYGVGFRVSSVVALLLLGFQGAALPLLMSRHEDERTPVELAQIFRIFAVLGLAGFVGVSLFADTAVRLLAAAEYRGADVAVPYLVAAALLFGSYVFAPGLWIARRTRVTAAIGVGAGLLNLGLAFALAPSLGIRGAGIAIATASGCYLALSLHQSQRHYPVPHGWPRLAAAAALAVAAVLVGRAAIPVGGDQALAAGPLVVKALATLAVTAGLVAILVSGAELRAALRRRPPA